MNDYWPVLYYWFGMLCILLGGATDSIWLCLAGIGICLGGILYVLDTRLK